MKICGGREKKRNFERSGGRKRVHRKEVPRRAVKKKEAAKKSTDFLFSCLSFIVFHFPCRGEKKPAWWHSFFFLLNFLGSFSFFLCSCLFFVPLFLCLFGRRERGGREEEAYLGGTLLFLFFLFLF